MNVNLPRMILIGILLNATMAHALGLKLEPYVGGGYEGSFQNKGKNNDFARYYNGGHFFVGTRWCDCGLELGYEATQRTSKPKPETLTTDLLNEVIGPNNGASYLGQGGSLNVLFPTKNKFEAWYLDLNGYVPVCNNLEVVGSLGYSWMKPKIYSAMQLNANNGTIQLPGSGFTPTVDGNLYRKFTSRRSHKAIFRFGAGLQYMVCNCVGVRGMVRWKNTESLKTTIPEGSAQNPSQYIMRPKNMISVSADAFISF